MASLLAMLPYLLPLIVIGALVVVVLRYVERPECPECGAKMKISSRMVVDRYSTLDKKEERYSCPACGYWHTERYSPTATTPRSPRPTQEERKRNRDRFGS